MTMLSSETRGGLGRDVDEWALATVLRGMAPFLSPDHIDRALAIAFQIRDTHDFLEALSGLGPYLPEPRRLEAAREALRAAWSLNDGDDRTDNFYFAILLHELAPWLPDEAMEETLAELADADIEIYDRAEAVTELMPHLPEALKAPALEMIWEPSASSRSYHWMSDIASHLTSDLALQVYEAILEQDDLHYHALTLVRLAPRLPSDLRESGIETALAAVQKVEFLSVRADWMAELAPHLPPPIGSKALTELLAEIRQIDDAAGRITALTGIAPHLPESEAWEAIQEAIVAVRDLKPADLRLIMITDIVPLLPEAERNEAVADLFAFLKGGSKSPNRYTYVEKIVPYLTDSLQADAVSVLGEIEQVQQLAHVLSNIAPCLGSQARRKALAVAGDIAETEPKATALQAFAVNFTGEQKTVTIQKLAELLAGLAGTAPPGDHYGQEIDKAVGRALDALSKTAQQH